MVGKHPRLYSRHQSWAKDSKPRVVRTHATWMVAYHHPIESNTEKNKSIATYLSGSGKLVIDDSFSHIPSATPTKKQLMKANRSALKPTHRNRNKKEQKRHVLCNSIICRPVPTGIEQSSKTPAWYTSPDVWTIRHFVASSKRKRNHWPSEWFWLLMDLQEGAKE